MKQLNKYIVRELGTDNVSILSEQDKALIGSYNLEGRSFIPGKYVLDLDFYDLNDNFIETVRNYKGYRIPGAVRQGEATVISVDPVQDALNREYLGDVRIRYSVFNNLFSPSENQNENSLLFISDISSDRTEIRAKSTTISDNRLRHYATEVYDRLNNQSYFSEVYLDFVDEGIKAACVNIITEVVGRELYVTFKLYEPLPANSQLKSRFAVVERVGEPTGFEVIREVEIQKPEKNILRGPNFNVDTERVVSSTTDYLNYAELLSSPLRTLDYEQYSLLKDNSARLSIDYSDFSNFIHFSSAVERLENFRYKLGLIRDCELSGSYFKSVNDNDPNIKKYEQMKLGIISNFDHYDRFLYFESGTFAWPKESSERPYRNVDPSQTMPVGPESGSIQEWWEGIRAVAEKYDEQNGDLLANAVPDSISNNPDNETYVMFVHMIGQHFDNEWIYAKALSEKYNADNRVDFGISRDLVRDAIREFGINLYETNQNLAELFSQCKLDGTYETGSEKVEAVLRITPRIQSRIFDGEYALWNENDPVKSIDGEWALWPSSSFVEVIDGEDADLSSDLQPITLDEYRKEVYKRIYHNIPYLIKTKGTTRGLRALINCFGIPENILEIRVQGGVTGSIDPRTEVTSSLSKIRLDNTGSWAPLLIESGTVISSSVLSEAVSQYSRKGSKYSDDSPVVEVGFSLNRQSDERFKGSSGSLDAYSNIVGNPKNSKENYGTAYKGLRRDLLAEMVEESGTKKLFRSPGAIIRLVRYFDSMLFRSLKEFLPARSSVATGVIVEDSILNRNRYKGIDVTGTEKSYSGSIGIGSISGSDGGSFDTKNSSKYEEYSIGTENSKKIRVFDPSVTYKEHWTTPEVTGSKLIFDNSPKYDGELSGSSYTVSDGNLLKNNLYRGKLVDGNPYLHSNSPAETIYQINFRFLTLPAPLSCNLTVVGSTEGLQYYVYSLAGRPTYVLGGEEYVIETGLGVTGSAIVPISSSSELHANPDPTSYFFGWYKGNKSLGRVNMIGSRITTSSNITIPVEDSTEYTARYPLPEDNFAGEKCTFTANFSDQRHAESDKVITIGKVNISKAFNIPDSKVWWGGSGPRSTARIYGISNSGRVCGSFRYTYSSQVAATWSLEPYSYDRQNVRFYPFTYENMDTGSKFDSDEYIERIEIADITFYNIEGGKGRTTLDSSAGKYIYVRYKDPDRNYHGVALMQPDWFTGSLN